MKRKFFTKIKEIDSNYFSLCLCSAEISPGDQVSHKLSDNIVQASKVDESTDTLYILNSKKEECPLSLRYYFPVNPKVIVPLPDDTGEWMVEGMIFYEHELRFFLDKDNTEISLDYEDLKKLDKEQQKKVVVQVQCPTCQHFH